MHHDPVVPILLALSLIFIGAKLGAIIADKLHQPSVLGELLAGVIMGNLALFGIHNFEWIIHDHSIEIFAGLGVIILLFEVGLESNVREMMDVGWKSLLVAIVGVVTPFVLGYYACHLILPDLPEMSKVFTGAILTATSVGITARVFKDLNFIKAEESRIVLGAAVIDDILGLIILAIVSAIAVSGEISAGSILAISTKSLGFVVLALVLGVMLAERTIKMLSFFKVEGVMLISALTLCFLGAYFANQVGLATIVGAFAVGLVLDELHFKTFGPSMSIEEHVRPISLFFVPIFFVITGMHVDLSVFTDIGVLSASLAISAIAILGKLVCGWAFSSKGPVDRLIIGIGMIPRGEVGLIFATVGKNIGVVDDRLYAITVIMVILTTLLPPPILAVLIKRKTKKFLGFTLPN